MWNLFQRIDKKKELESPRTTVTAIDVYSSNEVIRMINGFRTTLNLYRNKYNDKRAIVEVRRSMRKAVKAIKSIK